MVNTAELRQIFPLRENTLRHVVEGDGRYPRAMTPSELQGKLRNIKVLGFCVTYIRCLTV